MKRGLITLRASDAIDAAKPLPSRVKVLHWGENETRFGTLKVNEITLASLPANQARLKRDHVVIDFQHNTVEGSPFYQGEPAKVAARRATPEVVRGEGVYLSAIDWTQDGKENAANYCDLSAAVKRDDNNNVIFIHSAAVCRQGEVEGITLPLSADPFNSAGDSDDMKYKNLLCAILALNAESATDTDIETAAKKFGEKAGAETDVTTLSAALDKALKPLITDIDAMKNRDVVREREQILTLAAHAGKEVPASVLPDKDGKGGLDNSALKTFVDGLAVTVPLEKRTAGNVVALAATGLGATATTDEIVRKNLGISEEAWKKQNK